MLVAAERFSRNQGKRSKRLLLKWLPVAAVAAVLIYAAIAFLIPKQLSPAIPETLSNRVVLDKIGNARGSVAVYQISVPAGASELLFTLSGDGGSGTADIYAKLNEQPTTGSFDVKDVGTEKEKTISIPDPQPGTYYLLVHAAHGSYSDQSLVASYAPGKSVFKVGMHAHRLFNGGDWDGPASATPLFQYGVIRDWDVSHIHDASVWKSDGTIDFKLIEKVYAGHAKQGAKVIKTFGTVPTWASKRPSELNKQYPNWPGAKSGPRNLDEYEDYIFRFRRGSGSAWPGFSCLVWQEHLFRQRAGGSHPRQRSLRLFGMAVLG